MVPNLRFIDLCDRGLLRRVRLRLPAPRRYRQVVSIIGRIYLGCTSNPLLVLIFMTAPASVFMILLGKNFVANLDAANILPDLVFGAERSNVCFSTSLHIGGQRA